MPAPLKDLLRDLTKALEAGDRERIATTRRLIVEGHPETNEAAEASYKLGLDALFFGADLDAAVECFRTASKMKSPAWSAPARVSLGMALFRQGKLQQSIFELRKVGGAKPPTITSAQALAIAAGFLRQSGNKPEAERTRAEAIKLLEQLVKSTAAEESALAHYLLGLERKLEGKRDLAKKHLSQALAGKLDPTFADKAKAVLGEL